MYKRPTMLAGMVTILALVALWASRESDVRPAISPADNLAGSVPRPSAFSPSGLLVPSGVNFGSWLSLEDYFFVGEFPTPKEKKIIDMDRL